MSIKSISSLFCQKMVSLNSVDEIENNAIQYGLESILETTLKQFLLGLGFILERKPETVIILIVFCGLRSQVSGSFETW